MKGRHAKDNLLQCNFPKSQLIITENAVFMSTHYHVKHHAAQSFPSWLLIAFERFYSTKLSKNSVVLTSV